MMYRIVFILLVCQVASADNFLYVINSLDESLGWINTTTWEYDAQAVTLGYLPNDVLATPDFLYVVNSGNNNIQVIDRSTLETVRVIELNDAVNPWAIAALDNGKLAVTASVSGTLSIVDPLDGGVDTTFRVGTSPQAVFTSAHHIYVLDTGIEWPVFNPGTLKQYSFENYELLDSVVVGVNPQSAIIGFGNIQVLCTGNYDDVEGSIAIVDTVGGLSLVATEQIGGSPGAVATGNGFGFGAGWIAAGGWDTEGYLFLYDIVTYEIHNGPSNPIITGVGATDVVAEPREGGLLYVSCFGSGTVEVRSTFGELSEVIEMGAGASALEFWMESAATKPGGNIVTPSEFDISNAYPNPFNGSVSLEWAGQLRTPNTIKIFDVLGRNVKELPVGAGTTRISWSPGLAGGLEVAAGVYFARFDNEPSGRPIRIVYLK